MIQNEYDTIVNEHENELRNIHIIFNQEIKNIKENYNTKINILQMQLEELEMKQFLMKEKIIKLISNM
jgi:hypothetical protein